MSREKRILCEANQRQRRIRENEIQCVTWQTYIHKCMILSANLEVLKSEVFVSFVSNEQCHSYL